MNIRLSFVLIALLGCGREPEPPIPAAPSPQRGIAHPRVIEVTFNPSSHEGKLGAFASFQFVYDRTDQIVLTRIRENWDTMLHRVMDLLLARGADELTSQHAVEHLTEELRRDLSATLFPLGAAQVIDIIWRDLRIL